MAQEERVDETTNNVKGYRDSKSTKNVYTQFSKLDYDNNLIIFDTLVQFHVNPLDLWGKKNIYTLTVPDALKPYIDHVESDMYGVGGKGKHWNYDEENKRYYAPLMSVSGGLFSNTWIGSNPNYLTTRIVLNKPWEEIKSEIIKSEGENIPFSFVGYFKNGDLITNITNDTQMPAEENKVQKIIGSAGNEMPDNFISRSFVYADPNEAYNDAEKTYSFTHYFHISPFVTYTTSMGNKPYMLHLDLPKEVAPYIQSVTIKGIGHIPRRTVTFDRDNSKKYFDEFDQTGTLKINIFNEDALKDKGATIRELFSKGITGAYPLGMDFILKFKTDGEKDIFDLIQAGIINIPEGDSVNKNLYFSTSLYSYAEGKENGIAKNSYAGSYLSFTDTDKDGLLDKYEIYKSFTNPLDKDTDDDGKTDSEEINTHRTDPNVKAVTINDLSYDTEKLTINTAPSRKVVLYDITNQKEVATEYANGDGVAELNVKNKLVVDSEVEVRIYTDSKAKDQITFTMVYENPEVSNRAKVLNKYTEVIDPVFEMSGDAIAPYNESGNKNYTIKVSTRDTKSGDKYTVRVYKKNGKKIGEEEFEIKYNTNNVNINLTYAAMNKEYEDGEELLVTTQRYVKSSSTWEAETPLDKAKSVAALGRLEAPKVIVPLNADNWNDHGFKEATVKADEKYKILELKTSIKHGNFEKYLDGTLIDRKT